MSLREKNKNKKNYCPEIVKNREKMGKEGLSERDTKSTNRREQIRNIRRMIYPSRGSSRSRRQGNQMREIPFMQFVSGLDKMGFTGFGKFVNRTFYSDQRSCAIYLNDQIIKIHNNRKLDGNGKRRSFHFSFPRENGNSEF